MKTFHRLLSSCAVAALLLTVPGCIPRNAHAEMAKVPTIAAPQIHETVMEADFIKFFREASPSTPLIQVPGQFVAEYIKKLNEMGELHLEIPSAVYYADLGEKVRDGSKAMSLFLVRDGRVVKFGNVDSFYHKRSLLAIYRHNV